MENIRLVLQIATLHVVLNFDPKFKDPEYLCFSYYHGHPKSYGSVVHRAVFSNWPGHSWVVESYRVGLRPWCRERRSSARSHVGTHSLPLPLRRCISSSIIINLVRSSRGGRLTRPVRRGSIPTSPSIQNLANVGFAGRTAFVYAFRQISNGFDEVIGFQFAA